MEVSGVVFRPLPCCSGAGLLRSRIEGSTRFLSVPRRSSSEFTDDGHLRYSCRNGSNGVVCKKKEAKENRRDAGEAETAAAALKKANKKRMKVLKGLSRELSALALTSSLANNGGDGGGGGMDMMQGGAFKGQMMISEAAEALLAELKQLKAAEKDMKRRRKEEKAAERMKARMAADANASSTYSSSESIDSECRAVVDMGRLRSGEAPQAQLKRDQQKQPPQSSIQAEEASSSSSSSSRADKYNTPSEVVLPRSFHPTEELNATKMPSFSTCCDSSPSIINACLVSTALSSERVEVCMGGKCKRSGAVALLEEFQRTIGVEGAVVGCKCMGKCRDGPNVRVLKDVDSMSFKASNNPLWIGVGLEDVGAIAANFFGEKEGMGLMAVS